MLEKHCAHATFFMIGELAQAYPELVRQVAGAGHAIGNHSWSHLSLPLLTKRECREQIRACREILQPYGERLFRPPYCHLTLSNCWTILRNGHQIVAFDVHAEDWLNRDADWMAERLIQRIHPGCIIILHDNIFRSILPAARHDRAAMLAALDMTLERLNRRYEFVTVAELLRRGRPQRQLWRSEGVAELRPALGRYVQSYRQQTSV
jgi:peptidoglycan/xylan/chitin deacetylase (PgdA/CDA1 family)